MREWYRQPGNAERKRMIARASRQRRLEDIRAADRARGWRVYDIPKIRARLAVSYAIEKGRISREPCERCGSDPAHAHHDDYTKPLDIRWLCSSCHGIEHRVVA
jgi:ribosomal protein S27AE